MPTLSKTIHGEVAPGFRFEEGNHTYWLGDKKLTGVTTILNTVIAKNSLIQWAADMAVNYIREHQSLAEESLEEARVAHRKKKEVAGERGTDVHAQIENYIKTVIETNGGVPVQPNDVSDLMVQRFIDWSIANEVKFLASEKQVFCRSLWFAGTADFTFEKGGKRFVGDLKTMKKMWDRVPFFQTAAYMIALEEMGEEKYDGSCIVNINKETSELTDYWTYDHENDKEAFRAALTLYRQLNNF